MILQHAVWTPSRQVSAARPDRQCGTGPSAPLDKGQRVAIALRVPYPSVASHHRRGGVGKHGLGTRGGNIRQVSCFLGLDCPKLGFVMSARKDCRSPADSQFVRPCEVPSPSLPSHSYRSVNMEETLAYDR